MSDRPDTPSPLARRAQLKLDRQRGIDPEATSPVAGAPEAEPALPPAVAGEDALAELPPPEELGGGDDFSRYLIDGVSDELRKRALARLFHLPQYNITDGLNDYDDDYTKLEPLGDMPTYQKRRMERPAAPEEAEPADAAPNGGEAADPDTPAEVAAGDEAADTADTADTAESGGEGEHPAQGADGGESERRLDGTDEEPVEDL